MAYVERHLLQKEITGVGYRRARCSFVQSFTRTALNVPGLEDLCPTKGENSTFPAIKSEVSNLPLNVNVPASRPILPSGNSIGPEKVSEFASPRVHLASEGLVSPHALAMGSVNMKMPLPSGWASKRSECSPPAAKLISTFHVPLTFGDCARANATQHTWASRQSVNDRVSMEKLTTNEH